MAFAEPRNLVEALQLKDITLVVHDFGGPIGLSFAIRRKKLISKVVLLNTFLGKTASNPAARKVDKIVRSALGRFCICALMRPQIVAQKRIHRQAKTHESHSQALYGRFSK